MQSRKVFSLPILLFLALAACAGKPSAPAASPPAAPTPRATQTQPPDPSPASTVTPIPSPTPSGEVTLIAVGDLMLGRGIGELILQKGAGQIFSGVQPVLDAADLRVGNLECALTDTGTPEKKIYNLKAPPEAALALAAGRFDLVSLANNHAMDYGYAGLARSRELLASAGVGSVGAGKDFAEAHSPVILERNGLKIAFLAYVDVPEERDGFDARTWIATAGSPGIAWADPAQVAADVRSAKAEADVVVVLLHSGNEITPQYLSVITLGQREEAEAAIDAGAALVVGSHPHELQSIEPYHGGLIAYSLGNFVFDEYKGVANATVILRVKLSRAGFVSYDYVPVLIEGGLPQVIDAARAPAIGTLVAP